jgi:hypothetical protein
MIYFFVNTKITKHITTIQIQKRPYTYAIAYQRSIFTKIICKFDKSRYLYEK